MTGDTWGISGPRFLQIFALLAAAGLVVALVWRRWATRGADGARRPGPDELAYLNGGANLAVFTAVTGLRVGGAVDLASDAGMLVASGPVPPGFSDLDHAVHAALRTPAGADRLPTDPGVAGALRRIEDRLLDAGLLLSATHRAAARTAALVMFAVTALGVARIVAGTGNGKPVTYIVLLTIVTLVLSLRLLAVPTVSRAGRGLLARERGENGHLRPAMRPSWETYGAGGAMLGVALYGTAAMWAADPAYAAHARIAQASTWGSTDSGSGCGGGSSCGGGGGCGGGGCGG